MGARHTTKYLIIALALLAQLSCSQKSVFGDTPEGLLVESELFAWSQYRAMESLEESIERQEKKLQEGDEQAKKVLAQQLKQKEVLNAQLINLEEVSRKGRLVFSRPKPKPVCPPKDVAKCVIGQIEVMLVDQGLLSVEAKIVDAGGKVVATLQDKPEITDKNSGYDLYRFNWEEKSTSGEATIQVNRTESNKKKYSYTYPIIIK